MAVEAIDWLDVPSLTDEFDSTRYAMGVEFTVSESTPCPGIRWRVPDSLTPVPGSGYVISLFQDGTGLIRQQGFTPVAGGDQDILWDDQGPVTLTPGNTYTAQVYTERYTFRGSSSYPYATPNGIVSAVRGKLTAGVTTPATEATGNTTTSRFYVSPLIGTVDDPAITAALTLTLPAFDAELTAEATIAATLALTLPEFDTALSVDVAGGDTAMGLAAVMEEIAAVLRTYTTPRFNAVHAQPPTSLGSTPAAIVGFPERIVYSLTYDRVEQYQRIPVFAVAGQPNIAPKTLRGLISGWATGAGSLVTLLEAYPWTSCTDVIVSEADVGAVTVAGVEFIAVIIYMDATGNGA